MASAPPSVPTRPAAPGQNLVVLGVMLAAFITTPWLIRPLEPLLPAANVALIGQIAESVFGVILGAWMFRMIRRQQALTVAHACEIERMTEADALTGLGNHRALARELELTLNRARRSREPVTVMYFDIDAMDEVNRRHGRSVGDQTLRMMGAVLRSSLRFGLDTSYRLDKEDFAIVLAADRDAAQAVRHRLEWNFQERTPRQSQLNIGVVTWDGTKSAEGLLEEARRALSIQRQTAMVGQMA